MKAIKLVWIWIFLFACEAQTVNTPPSPLLPERTVENMLYDMALLNGLETANMVKEGQAIFNSRYLEKKYNVPDSVWQANKRYYAQHPRIMGRIYQRIKKRIERATDSLKVLSEKQVSDTLDQSKN